MTGYRASDKSPWYPRGTPWSKQPAVASSSQQQPATASPRGNRGPCTGPADKGCVGLADGNYTPPAGTPTTPTTWPLVPTSHHTHHSLHSLLSLLHDSSWPSLFGRRGILNAAGIWNRNCSGWKPDIWNMPLSFTNNAANLVTCIFRETQTPVWSLAHFQNLGAITLNQSSPKGLPLGQP